MESQEWNFDGLRAIILTDLNQSCLMVISLPVNIGVSQGSILCPLLFLLFLNDLPNIAQDCSVNMYADDTEMENMCKPDEHIQLENRLNNYLCRLKKYVDVNRLSINIAKCVFMLIGKHQALQKMLDIRLHIDNEPLKRVSIAKYICMYIDENPKWNVHIDEIIPKISAIIGVLRSLRKIIPIDTFKLLYNAIVLPPF